MIFGRSTDSNSRKTALSVLVLVCISILAYIAIIEPWSLRQENVPLSIGEVAPQDLRAPRSIQYSSSVLTEEARDEAERSVAPVYVPPDPAIARAQSEKLNSILISLSKILDNQLLTSDQKRLEFIKIPEITLRPSSQDILLSISDTRWETVRNEAITVLQLALQNPVRTEDLESIRQNLPSLVNLALNEKEVSLVVDLVSPMIIANSFYSPELTESARQSARDAVEQVTRSFVIGQTVVSRGQVITALDIEALTELGLVQPKNKSFNLIGAAALIIISALFTIIYFWRIRPGRISDLRSRILLAFLFIIFLFGAHVINPNRTIMPYLYPMPAFALLISALFGMEHGIVFGFLASLLASYGMPDSLSLFPYYTLTSLCGVLALGQARRIGQFLFAALSITLAGITSLVAYRLPFTEIDWVGLFTLMGAAVFTGIASSGVALPIQYLLAQFLGLTTALQLLEISRPDSPLLNFFLQSAPGTYQHSLQVANLAEQAAERIHADTLLVRVGSLFHDVGKSTNPLFFIENQPSNEIDSHDDLPPEKSARDIIRHVQDGLELARKYRLPKRLFDFISEHHGTLITRYQYNRAIQEVKGDASKVDENLFRYPGPKPRSKETAILMIADNVEAQARAERPNNEDQVRMLVKNVIERCQADGQLDQAPLSQLDLSNIAESFIDTLRVTYHPRLEYPREQQSVKTQKVKELQEPIKPARKNSSPKNRK